jgi:PPOX class probable F420-dependent enzyme
MPNFNSELGRAARKLLDSQSVIWLTTVDSGLTPQPRPVWFVPDGDHVLIYSQPAAAKVAHIRRHPQVALHFNSDQWGSEETLLVLTGAASLDAETRPANRMTAYVEKYRSGMAELGMTPEQFAARYSQPIRVIIQRMRGG